MEWSMSCFVQFVRIRSLKKAGDVFGPSDVVLRWTRPGWEPGSEQHTMLCQVRSVASVAQLVGPLFTVAHSDSFAHIYKTAGYSSSVIPSNSDFSLFLQNTHRPLVKCWSPSLLVQTPGMMAERMIFFFPHLFPCFCWTTIMNFPLFSVPGVSMGPCL